MTKKKKNGHNKYYYDAYRNYPYNYSTPGDVKMSCPPGLEFNTPYSIDDLKPNRKNFPIYTGVVKYFPDALKEVSNISRIGNEQHHPGEPLHWDKSKSTDHLDALMRHLLQADEHDDDGCLHLAKVAWRALAALQHKLESKGLDDPNQQKLF
jgi:hypothetical protein